MKKHSFDIITVIPPITVGVFLIPIIAGLGFVFLAGLGVPNMIGVATPETDGKLLLWAFFDQIGISRTLIFTIFIGLTATLLSWGLNVLFLGFGLRSRLFQICQKLLSPILATPHITLAVGLLFLVAPSGLLARFLAVPFGFEQPPFWHTNPDPYGILLLIGLVMKELPFLFLLSLSSLERIDMKKHLLTAQSFGYSESMAFFKLIYPILYAQMRLPIFVVLAFSLAILDMALVLAPHAPSLLAVKILQWARDPDLSMQYFAAAGAFWMLILTIALIILWALIGKLLAMPYGAFIISGRRDCNFLEFKRVDLGRYLVLFLVGMLVFAAMGSIVMLLIWSVTGLWQFPDLLPPQISWRYWMQALNLMRMTVPVTLFIALCATLLSLILVIGCLETESRYDRRPQKIGVMMLYLPLLIPQISFLFGVKVLLLRLHVDNSLWVIIAGHMIFILPYLYLSLAGPWHRLAPHYRLSAYMMGKTPNQTLLRLILPLQFSPILTAFALGVSVSIALYLPTYLLGGGETATLTTEVIVLSSGGNRRIVSVFGLVQAFIPFMFFALALFVPRMLYKHRREMNIRV